jgi:excisionase family DNA binding protein
MNYSLREASKILGVKVRTLRSWISSGKIKAFKADDKGKGHYWRIEEEEIERIKGALK